MRASALGLFSELSLFGDCDAYREQIHTNMVALLLHLGDDDKDVRKVSEREQFTHSNSLSVRYILPSRC